MKTLRELLQNRLVRPTRVLLKAQKKQLDKTTLRTKQRVQTLRKTVKILSKLEKILLAMLRIRHNSKGMLFNDGHSIDSRIIEYNRWKITVQIVTASLKYRP